VESNRKETGGELRDYTSLDKPERNKKRHCPQVADEKQGITAGFPKISG